MERKTPPPGYICHRCNVPGMSVLENILLLLMVTVLVLSQVCMVL